MITRSPSKKVKTSKSESGSILWVKTLKHPAVQSDLGWWRLFTCGLPRTRSVGRAIHNVLSMWHLVHISFGIFWEYYTTLLIFMKSIWWKVSSPCASTRLRGITYSNWVVTAFPSTYHPRLTIVLPELHFSWIQFSNIDLTRNPDFPFNLVIGVLFYSSSTILNVSKDILVPRIWGKGHLPTN